MNGECSEEDTETAITKDEQNTEKEGKAGEKEVEKDGEKEGDKGGENEGTKDGEKEEEGDKDQEVVLIQDTGFNVKIIVPGIEEFELPVSSSFITA